MSDQLRQAIAALIDAADKLPDFSGSEWLPEYTAALTAFDAALGTCKVIMRKAQVKPGIALFDVADLHDPESSEDELDAYDAALRRLTGKSDACDVDGYHNCAVATCGCECHAAVRLLQEALHLCQHGENAPGGTETWGKWIRKTENFLRALPDWDAEPGPYKISSGILGLYISTLETDGWHALQDEDTVTDLLSALAELRELRKGVGR